MGGREGARRRGRLGTAGISDRDRVGLLTGADPEKACYDGPQFEVRSRTATGALIDALPPGPVVADAALRTLAYGPQLWCAR